MRQLLIVIPSSVGAALLTNSVIYGNWYMAAFGIASLVLVVAMILARALRRAAE